MLLSGCTNDLITSYATTDVNHITFIHYSKLIRSIGTQVLATSKAQCRCPLITRCLISQSHKRSLPYSVTTIDLTGRHGDSILGAIKLQSIIYLSFPLSSPLLSIWMVSPRGKNYMDQMFCKSSGLHGWGLFTGLSSSDKDQRVYTKKGKPCHVCIDHHYLCSALAFGGNTWRFERDR